MADRLNKIIDLAVQHPRLRKGMRWAVLNILAPVMRLAGYGNKRRKSVLYVGQAYYNHWYLSRGLRSRGWNADVLNWDPNPSSQIYYHGEDFNIPYEGPDDLVNHFNFYLWSLRQYDVFHFANKGGLQFGEPMRVAAIKLLGEEGSEIRFLKKLGKKIVYSNNGCLDGVSQTGFSKWGPESVCSICRWQNEPSVCSDQLNLSWGKFRNELADYQCLLGGNHIDYNDSPTVHEVPEFYCLEPAIWDPSLPIPEKYQLDDSDPALIRLYHAVGNRELRTRTDGKNIKSSHIYLPLVDKLKGEGLKLELIEPTDIPNKEVRFLQMQADIFLDMLTYGWFGANVREAMMLGKPVICFLREEWLDSMRAEIPEYVDELPIVSANPNNIEEVLRDLINNKEKRLSIGQRSREFALKWHSTEAAARRFEDIYSKLLGQNT